MTSSFGILALGGCSVTTSGSGGAGTGGSSPVSVETGARIACGDTTCAEGTEYCGFAKGTCSGAKACRAFDADCTETKPVCGCDGESHLGACGALHDSGGIFSPDACVPPTGKFNCAYGHEVPIMCDTETQFCRLTPSHGRYEKACVNFADCTASPLGCHCANVDIKNNCAYSEGMDCSEAPTSGAVTLTCP